MLGLAVRAAGLVVTAPRAVGVRLPYAGVPARVRAWVEDTLGSSVVATAEQFLESVAGASGAGMVSGITFTNVMTFTLVVALLEVIVVSALGAIFAALFTLAVHVSGGWKVTFGSD